MGMKEGLQMEFMDVVKTRHSVRDFDSQVIDRQMIEQLVKTAQQAPSWVNSQPWQVYVATGHPLSAIKEWYRRLTLKGVPTDPDIPVMHRNEWDRRSQDNMRQWRHKIVHHFPSFDEAHRVMTTASNELNHAPVILYLTIPQKSPEWSIFDAGLFAETLMLAATDRGLVTIPTYNSVRYPQVLRQVLTVPFSQRFVIGIEVGYPTVARVNQFRTKRVPLNDCLHFADD